MEPRWPLKTPCNNGIKYMERFQILNKRPFGTFKSLMGDNFMFLEQVTL